MNFLNKTKQSLNKIKYNKTFSQENTKNNNKTESITTFFFKRITVVTDTYFSKEKQIIKNFKKDKNYKRFIYLLTTSTLYKISKTFSSLFLNFYIAYFGSLCIFLLNKKKSFFSFIEDENDIFTVMKSKLDEIDYLFDKKNKKERNKFIVYFFFMFKILYKFFFKGEISFGEIFHASENHFTTTVLSELKKIDFVSYVFSAVKFFVYIFLFNILASALSLIVSWYLMTTKFFLFYKNIVHSFDLLPIVSLSIVGMFFSQNIVDKIWTVFKIKAVKIKLEESNTFFYINLITFFLLSHSKSDSDFFSIEKDKPYLNIFLVNGIKKNNILKINKNNLLIHKINNFNLNDKLRTVFLFLKPQRFKSVNFCYDIFHKLSHSCCNFNPFLESFQKTLILFIFIIIGNIFSFIISTLFIIFNREVIKTETKKEENNWWEYSKTFIISLITLRILINLLCLFFNFFILNCFSK